MVALAAGIVSNLRTPIYRATAKVLLTPNDPNQQLNPTGANGVAGADADRFVAGQITIAQGQAVADEAAKSLQGVTASSIEAKLSVTQGGQSNVLNVSATDPDPSLARDIADAVAKGYIENRRKAAVAGLQGAADDIQSKLGPLQLQIAQLDTQIGDGSNVPGASSTLVSPLNPGTNLAPSQPATQVTPATAGLGGAPSTQEALKAARYAAAVQYETLYSRQQELLVDISLKRGDAELIAEAKTPTAPVSPHPKRQAALGGIIGLVLGVGISVLREQLNDRVRTAQEVEELTRLPLLAQLPYDSETARNRGNLAMVERPASPLSEALRSLRTSIQYLGVDKPVKVILVTSAAPGEGKSLVAANLAIAFAQANYRTVLISADLRRSSIDAMFGDLPPSVGLTGLLAPFAANGKNPRNDLSTNGDDPAGFSSQPNKALLRTSIEGLVLLRSGPTPPNPAELLGSGRMAVVLSNYAAHADMVIIDSPPLLPVTDAAVLAAKCDGVVLVTALNETRSDALARARVILDTTGGRILGIVINKTPSSGPGGEYYYGYSGVDVLARDAGSKRRKGRRRRGRDDVREAASSSVGSGHTSVREG